MSEKLLKELVEEIKRLHDTLSILQQDVNCIRNGEYDKPQGASSGMPKAPVKDIDFTRKSSGEPLKTSREW